MCEAGVKFTIAGLFSVIERSIPAKGKDQIDVGGKIEFKGAEFSHPKNDEVLRLAALIQGSSETFDGKGKELLEGLTDNLLGEVCEVA